MSPSKNPKLGAHVSIAGGIQNAPLRAAQEGLDTFQCFSRSPQGGPAPALTEDVLDTFGRNMRETGMEGFVIHAPYYINAASLDDRIRNSSIRVLREELERGSVLKASFVMFHPGSFKDQTQEGAIGLVRQSIGHILDGYAGSCKLLIEISAGAGNVLGDTFQEVADMMAEAKTDGGFGGVCFDTCHAFASGYDFSDERRTAKVLREFDNTIGLKWLRLTHVNDSKTPMGGKRDRHEHIGKGHIGISGITSILNTSAFQAIDWILETETDGRAEDVRALRQILADGQK